MTTKFWKKKVSITELFEEQEVGGDSQAVGMRVAERLKSVFSVEEIDEYEELQDIVNSFEKHVPDEEEFNYWMGRLYDWADHGKRLWIT